VLPAWLDFKSVMAHAVSRPRLGKHCVSVSTSDNRLVGFNSVLAAHLLSVDAGGLGDLKRSSQSNYRLLVTAPDLWNRFLRLGSGASNS